MADSIFEFDVNDSESVLGIADTIFDYICCCACIKSCPCYKTRKRE